MIIAQTPSTTIATTLGALGLLRPALRRAAPWARTRPDPAADPAHSSRTWEHDGVMCRVNEWTPPEALDRPTLLFLPGLLAANRHWGTVARSLARDHRCIALEVPYTSLRGARCSIEGVVDLASRFLADECPSDVVLVGSSLGGHAAARIAVDFPTRLAGLVLAGAGGLRERPPMCEITLCPTREWIATRIGVMFHDQRHVTEDELDRAQALFQDRATLRAFIRLARSSRDDRLGADLARIQTPTLVLWGREDRVTPPDSGVAFASAIPDSRLAWIDRCGHAPMVEAPREFVRHARAFLEEFR